jgi:anti-sigma regulatory factor (Ser/Thr protein kinase)
MMSNDYAEGLGRYSHDVLIHDTDEQLVDAVRSFVRTGLSSGGDVLVHSDERRVALLRDALGTHPGLEYGLDRDLYQSPMATLFDYQRAMRQDSSGRAHWVTGTVPMTEGPATPAAWARYESAVNEALGSFPFHALCTYDTRALPAHVVAAARATHPHVSDGTTRGPSLDYLDPGEFLTSPLAETPAAPAGTPTLAFTLQSPVDLAAARRLIRSGAATTTAPAKSREDLLAAASEVLANAVEHGGPPVDVEVWAEAGESRLTCRVTDHGGGIANTMAGYRYPDSTAALGLWVARQLCEDLVIGEGPDGGCSVLLLVA